MSTTILDHFDDIDERVAEQYCQSPSEVVVPLTGRYTR